MNWKKTPDHSTVTHLASTIVLKGHFLLPKLQKTTREGHLQNVYKEDTKTEAIIPQECIVYYGIDLVQKSQTFMYFKICGS